MTLLTPLLLFNTELAFARLMEEGAVDALTPVNYRRRPLGSYCSLWDRYDGTSPSPAPTSRRFDPAVPNPQAILDSHCVRAKFVDGYRLLTSVASWVTVSQLWDAAIVAEAQRRLFIRLGI